jgi:hypothetical protein
MLRWLKGGLWVRRDQRESAPWTMCQSTTWPTSSTQPIQWCAKCQGEFKKLSVPVSVSVGRAISLELRVFTALTSKPRLPPISQSTDTDTGTDTSLRQLQKAV